MAMHNIMQLFDSKQQTDFIILDFGKAFYTVPYATLFYTVPYATLLYANLINMVSLVILTSGYSLS